MRANDSMDILARSGWLIHDFVIEGETGTVLWLVSGSNGENLIRSRGPTAEIAWRRAVDQAAAVGMLQGW
ncbi:hypothetical protein ACYOEI_21700, partial [Singulisphaera rosea]